MSPSNQQAGEQILDHGINGRRPDIGPLNEWVVDEELGR